MIYKKCIYKYRGVFLGGIFHRGIHHRGVWKGGIFFEGVLLGLLRRLWIENIEEN